METIKEGLLHRFSFNFISRGNAAKKSADASRTRLLSRDTFALYR